MEKCAVCAKTGDAKEIRRCSRCLTTRYCSDVCQAQDWPRHKATCSKTSGDGPSTSGQSNPKQPERKTGMAAQAGADVFTSLFDGTFYKHKDPWQEARSRAEEEFPGYGVTDDLSSNLDLTEVEEHVPVIPPSAPSMPPGASCKTPGPPFLQSDVPRRLPSVHLRVSRKILVLRLVRRVYVPHLLCGWLVEDYKGSQLTVWFEIQEPLAAYFRYEDLQQGHFLCIKRAKFHSMPDMQFRLIVLKDASFVCIFKI